MPNKGNIVNDQLRISIQSQIRYRLDKDIDDYTEAIELNPSEASTYIKRGVAHQAKGEYDKAVADFTMGLRA